MYLAHKIAEEILPIFGENVVARKSPWTYGQYASAIGRDPAKHGLAIGKAMHAIGALCVFIELPVAPLYWVKNAHGGYRAIFESDPIERKHIIESKDVNAMYIVSREYEYKAEEFEKLVNIFRKNLDSGILYNISAHEFWHRTFIEKPENSSETYYERAINRYNELLQQLRNAR
jgi:hypothetical protein